MFVFVHILLLDYAFFVVYDVIRLRPFAPKEIYICAFMYRKYTILIYSNPIGYFLC